jgi:ubiquinone biosynthesis protein
MPDYFTLLARGLMLIESVGRTLNPEMNLIKSVEPYVKKIIAKRLSPDYLLRKGMNKLNDFGQDIQNIPYELRNVLQQLNEGKLTFQTQNKDLQQTNHILKNGIKDLILTFLLVANMIITVQILLAQHQTNFTNKLVFFSSFLVILFSGMLFFRMMKK